MNDSGGSGGCGVTAKTPETTKDDVTEYFTSDLSGHVVPTQWFASLRNGEQPYSASVNSMLRKSTSSHPLNTYSLINYIYIRLHCGLGNRLFKAASAYGIAKHQNKTYAIIESVNTYHCSVDVDYMNTIFRNLRAKTLTNNDVYDIFNEQEEEALVYLEIPNNDGSLLIRGYFQNETYFKNYKSEIYDLFRMEDSRKTYLINKYNNLDNMYFFHVRRGDYKLACNSMHNVDLTTYYKNCLQLLPQDANFLIFSDDIHYCKSMEILENKNTTFVENENELNSLYLMSLCRLGGIACNSSFSWWGSYLNENPNKFVTFPDKWFNVNWPCDIYWEGSTIICT